MVTTRRGSTTIGPTAAPETSKCDYERQRDINVALVRRRFQELGLHRFASNEKSHESATSSEGIRAGNGGRRSEDTDDSDYLPEAGEQVQGDTDDDSSLDDAPIPLMIIKPPKNLQRKTITSRRTKRTKEMAPGGSSRLKRVLSPSPNDRPAEDIAPQGPTQSKRVRFTIPNQGPPGVRTRSMQNPTERGNQDQPTETDNQDQVTEDDNDLDSPRGHDWSYQGCYDDHSVGEQEDLQQGEDENHEDQTTLGDQESAQSASRKPRGQTTGKLLDRMVKSMQKRMPITVAEGYNRPHVPVQAAKFASEAGVIVRDHIPILPHWKDYKKSSNRPIFENFIGKLSGRLCFDINDKAIEAACFSVMQSEVKQMRYKLKKKYFTGIPVDQIRTTSPVASMTDAQWNQLVQKWLDPKNLRTAESNKQNRGNVKLPQATGSRCYIATLHDYKQKKMAAARATQVNGDAEDGTAGEIEDGAAGEQGAHTDEELDAVEIFKECHTSRKKGVSDIAKEAIARMEDLKQQPPAEGSAILSTAQVVSSVLPKTSSNIFLKNIGMQPLSPTKQPTAKERALQEQLAAERQCNAALQAEVNFLKQKSKETDESVEKTQREVEGYKRTLEENNALLRTFFRLNGAGGLSLGGATGPSH